MSIACAPAAGDSGAASASQRIRPASKSSRPTPPRRRKLSLASTTRPAASMTAKAGIGTRISRRTSSPSFPERAPAPPRTGSSRPVSDSRPVAESSSSISSREASQARSKDIRRFPQAPILLDSPLLPEASPSGFMPTSLAWCPAGQAEPEASPRRALPHGRVAADPTCRNPCFSRTLVLLHAP
ncbi:uncharacterized protein STAUR_0268 [Stigmatella aurantiaca DW4/3-1]|nr:uncharacterized protein STAUR_0268 [Stigmatella aurantiaca DW4/3-1]